MTEFSAESAAGRFARVRSSLVGPRVAAIVKRIAAGLVVGLVAVTITFVIVRILPLDPAALVAGPNATPEGLERVRQDLGSNLPIHEQFGRYLAKVATLDFGTSIQTGHPVLSDIASRLPATIELTVIGLALGIVVGGSLGVFLAVRRRGPGVVIGEALTVAAVAIPEFWMGLILILVFYSVLGVAPPPIGRVDPFVGAPIGPTGFLLVDSLIAGNLTAFASAVGHLALPAIALAVLAFPSIARISSASLRSVLTEDFVLACRANGDRGVTLYVRRVLPVALPPVLTNVGIVVGYLLAGDFLLEKVFAWPGIGLYAVNAVQVGDLAVIQATVLLVALIYLVVFLAIDTINTLIDPRMIRHD